MKNTYTAVIKEDDGYWIGWIEEVPGVNCQETSREELVKSLRITLKEALKFNRQDALHSAETNFSEELVTV
ncbi:MAG: type II toxin-antitoxin system HicB family antitoxin [Candidatus Omnitrophica bacterium]|nr:type II toxin-antitoxin system HicB family antitoxin [Candidatus Omnitrophota bacterium]